MAESNRKIFYLSEETHQQFEDIRALFEKNKMGTRPTEAFKTIIALFHELFIEASPTTSLATRLDQLRGGAKQEDTVNRVMKKQLDMVTYLTLANYHLAKDPSWSPSNLTSIHSAMDKDQVQILEQVMSLINQDIAQGQTKKYSHRKD